MDYFDSFDCQLQCEEYGNYYVDWYNDDYYCTHGNYFEDSCDVFSNQLCDDFETLFDED